MDKFNLLAPVKLLLKLYIYLIAIFALGRVILFTYFYPRISDADVNVALTFLYGLRMDTIVACLFLLLPAFIIHFSPKIIATVSNEVIKIYFLIVLLVSIYMENLTLPFINEYDVRPNVIFINYLKYPHEVLPTIWATFKLELLVSVIMMSVAGWWFMRSNKRLCLDALAVPLWTRVLLFAPVLILLFAGMRSSFDHRPANPSDAVFSNNRLLNEITKSTIHNVGYAFYSQQVHDGSARVYGLMPFNEAKRRVSQRLNIPLGTNDAPFKRLVKSHFSVATKPKNLVILLEESLGALFVNAVGGEAGVTPHLNELSKHGLLFKRLYSNGTRSVRGIAGTVAGFLPAPGLGIVKRNLSQNNFFTVAGLLKPHGYLSSFFYGGESRFDTMKSWFSGNGFDEIIDEASFDADVFHGTWGVDDVALVEKADKRFKQWNDNKQLFVSVIFSSTNHKPFDFPEGVIDLVEGVPVKSVKNAVKYADFAIGRLIELAKQNHYFDDTVFMIVADHNIRVYGDDVLPVNMFQIPGLILGGGVKAKTVETLTTQPDVLATALDLIGLDLNYPILGTTIYADDKKEAVLMQFHNIYGLRVGNRLAVIQPDKIAQTFDVLSGDHLQLINHDEALEKDALAFVTVLDELYKRQLFH